MATAARSVNFCEQDVHRLEPLVSRNAIREKQRTALRLHVGRGRRYSVKELSDCAGIAERAIEAAMAPIDDENYRPLALEAVASIAKFLGAPFASHYLELSGLGAFELADGQPPLPKVFEKADVIVAHETPEEELRRILARAAELVGGE